MTSALDCEEEGSREEVRGGGSDLFWEMERREKVWRGRCTLPSVHFQRPPRPWVIHSWQEVGVLTWRQCRVSGFSGAFEENPSDNPKRKWPGRQWASNVETIWVFICLQKQNYLFQVSVPALGPSGDALQREVMLYCVIWPLFSTGYKSGGAVF